MEYIVIGNLNDGVDVAHELGKLLQVYLLREIELVGKECSR